MDEAGSNGEDLVEYTSVVTEGANKMKRIVLMASGQVFHVVEVPDTALRLLYVALRDGNKLYKWWPNCG